MNIKRLFINLIVVLFLGVIVLSVVTVIKRSNEPDDDDLVRNTQSVISDNVLEATETLDVTETTENSESSEQEESQTEETRMMYVQGSVNVRSGPGREYSLVGNLALNAEVIAVGIVENGWQKIIYRDTEAYISAEYLAETTVENETGQTQPVEPTPEATHESTPQPEATPESTPETTPEQTPEAAPGQTSDSETTPESTTDSESTPDSEVISDPESTTDSETVPEDSTTSETPSEPEV